MPPPGPEAGQGEGVHLGEDRLGHDVENAEEDLDPAEDGMDPEVEPRGEVSRGGGRLGGCAPVGDLGGHGKGEDILSPPVPAAVLRTRRRQQTQV